MARLRSAKRSYGGKSAEARARAREKKFVAAAVRVIGDGGYKAATVRAVCAEAGLTQRYFYEVFSDSEAMLIAVYNAHMATVGTKVLAGVAEARSPRETIANGLRSFFQLVYDEPGLARTILQEVLGVSPRVDAAYRAGNARIAAVITQFLGPVLGGEPPPGMNADVVAHAAIGAVVQVALRWMLADYDLEVDEIVETLVASLEAFGSGFDRGE